MRRLKKIDLENRELYTDSSFDTVEGCRKYDLSIRSSMTVPMGKVTTILSKDCKPNCEVLDVGTASGLLSLRLSGQNEDINITSVDDNENFLQVAQENASLAVICNAPFNVEFQYTCLEELPFDDNSFDVVFSYSAMHKWKEPLKVIKEMKRVCKSGGKIFIFDLARNADSGMISFICEYIKSGEEDFINELKNSYTTEEVAKMLDNEEMGEYKISLDDVNMQISIEK